MSCEAVRLGSDQHRISVDIQEDNTTSHESNLGDQIKLVSDPYTKSLLTQVLYELKVMNLHLQSISGLEVEAGDV